MSVATITPAKSATAKVEALAGAALESAVTALRARYEAADKSETDTRAAFERADIAWQNARVCKVRVAYAAAMLTPNKGAANLLAATRFLLTDPADTPAKRTAQAKSRKNTLRNYVAAGEALNEAGLANNIAEPDENERKIVADVFRELNKRDKQGDKPDTGEGEGEGTSKGEADTSGPATQADVIAAVEALQTIVNEFTRDHGFAGIVADNLAEVLAEIGTRIDSHRVDGGDAA